MLFSILLILFSVLILTPPFCTQKICGLNHKRNYGTFVKYLAAILVIVAHLTGIHRISLNLVLECSFGWCSVSLFFFYSGYGLMNGLQLKGAKYWDDFLRKRFTKVLIPLLFVYVLYYICEVCMGTERMSFCDILGVFFSDDPYLPFSWFVSWLLIIYILFYLAGKCSFFQFGFVKSFAFLFSIFICFILFSNMGAWVKVSMPCFLFGVLYRKKETEFLDIPKCLSVIVLFASLSFFLIAFNWIRICSFIGCPNKIIYSSVPLYGGSLAFCVYYVMLSKYVKEVNIKKIGLLNGSYELYLCQGVVFMLLSAVIPDSYLYYLCCIIGCIVIGYVVHRILSAVLSKVI